ncbi:MAG: hypothetical protein CND86_04520 [Bacteroidetes bacterium MED-G21]|nr:MAG: hypothetical protein CND86_04520 [Bacteroidetes bacterium MED-G21]
MKKLLYILLFVPLALFGQDDLWPSNPINNGGNSATYLLPNSNTVTINGQNLIYGKLGAFYTDDNGKLQNGGWIIWNNTPNNFSVQPDDSFTTEKDGFADGEEITWLATYDGGITTYIATVAYTIGPGGMGTSNFVRNGINIFSEFVVSSISYCLNYNDEDSICDVYAILGCTDETAFNFNSNATIDDGSCIDIVNGCLDNDYIEFNQLANTDDGSCEILFSEALDSLSNEFEELTAEATTSLSSLQQALDTWNTTIDLSAGWNMFGYGCPSSIDVADGLSNHTESIIITKDNNGNVYMPEFGFNGIGDFTPGFGYQIKLTEAIEGFSLCDWYVNDIPEDNIVSLQEENTSLQAELDSIYGCIDETACNYDESAFLDDGSCYNNDLGCGCDTPGPNEGYDCDGNELQYQVGGYAEGGIVFYLDESGEHGLVSAIEDLTEGATIDSEGNPGYQWGCFAMGISGADGQAIGTGYQNTMDIVNQGCTTEYGGITAAQGALNAEINGYSDWYLPSLDELKEMYNTIGNGGSDGNIGGFEYKWYWSSSESNNYGAYDVNFGDGSTGSFSSKTKMVRVRVIRSF